MSDLVRSVAFPTLMAIMPQLPGLIKVIYREAADNKLYVTSVIDGYDNVEEVDGGNAMAVAIRPPTSSGQILNKPQVLPSEMQSLALPRGKIIVVDAGGTAKLADEPANWAVAVSQAWRVGKAVVGEAVTSVVGGVVNSVMDSRAVKTAYTVVEKTASAATATANFVLLVLGGILLIKML